MKPTDLRGILQYIPQFREKTFVLAVDGPIVIGGSGDSTTNFTDVGAVDGTARYYRIRQVK